MSEAVLKTLGRYEIQEEIGRGMMGVVYRAFDPVLGRTVALKSVRLAFALSDEERRIFEKRFLAEARVAAGLSHPGIVVVHDVGRDIESGSLFIALEYLKGRTLSDLMASGAPMEWREALRIVQRLAEALHHAHSHRVVHRDVKPANIMILPSGEPKIMDFGIAKVPAAQLTTAGEFFGTPSYMSPEQASGEVVDGRSDIFSLGSVLYLLLTGRRAFDAESVPAILARVTARDPPLPSEVFPGLPPELDYLISRALAKDPAQRYRDGKTLAEDIEDILDGRPPRHRAGWQQPPRADETLVPPETLFPAETTDLRREIAQAGREVAWTKPKPFHSDGLARRALLVVGGLILLLGLAVLFLPSLPGLPAAHAPADVPAASFPSTLPTLPSSPATTVVEPGRLDVAFEHQLKSGSLRVWVDEDLLLDQPFVAEERKRLLFFKHRKGGALRRVLSVTPGEHVVRVRVEAEGKKTSRRIRGHFRSGSTRRLSVSVGDIQKKKISVVWGS